MKTLGENWSKATSLAAVVIAAAVALYACISTWAATPPGLAIVSSGSNQVSLTITNGTNTAVYNIYFVERMKTNSTWSLITIGATGQTNFTNVYDTKTGFFAATVNTDSLPITLTVTIVSPSNGAVVQ